MQDEAMAFLPLTPQQRDVWQHFLAQDYLPVRHLLLRLKPSSGNTWDETVVEGALQRLLLNHQCLRMSLEQRPELKFPLQGFAGDEASPEELLASGFYRFQSQTATDDGALWAEKTALAAEAIQQQLPLLPMIAQLIDVAAEGEGSGQFLLLSVSSLQADGQSLAVVASELNKK